MPSLGVRSPWSKLLQSKISDTMGYLLNLKHWLELFKVVPAWHALTMTHSFPLEPLGKGMNTPLIVLSYDNSKFLRAKLKASTQFS